MGRLSEPTPGRLSVRVDPLAVRTGKACDGSQTMFWRWAQPYCGHRPHSIMVRAVQAVATDSGAPISSLHAAASVIFVRGPWWRIVGPGEILCSAVTAQSDDDAYDALKAAFEPHG